MVLPLSTICEKDIGVLTVNNKCSNPSLQCESAVQKATQLQGRMSTVQVLLQGQVSLDHVYVRPFLEYCVKAWSPWLKSDIKLLESVQSSIVPQTLIN